MTTITQDPAGRYTLLIEEWRRIAAERNAGPVVSLLYDLITCILMFCASRAGRQRAGEIAEMAPARAPNSPCGGPPEALPRQSGGLAHRDPEDACGGGEMFEPCEPQQMQEPGAEAPRARVRKLQASCEPAPARPLHAGGGCLDTSGRASRVFAVRFEKSGFARAGIRVSI